MDENCENSFLLIKTEINFKSKKLNPTISYVKTFIEIPAPYNG